MGARRPLSEATKAKIAEALRGKPLTQERKDKIAAANTGKTNSPEARAKMSAAKKGLPPWKASRVVGNERIQGLWALLGDLYDFQTDNPSVGGMVAASHFNHPYVGSWSNMIDYCRKFPDGSWYQSKDYVNWMLHFDKAE